MVQGHIYAIFTCIFNSCIIIKEIKGIDLGLTQFYKFLRVVPTHQILIHFLHHYNYLLESGRIIWG